MAKHLETTESEFKKFESAKKDKLNDLEREQDDLHFEFDRKTLKVSNKMHDLNNKK